MRQITPRLCLQNNMLKVMRAMFGATTNKKEYIVATARDPRFNSILSVEASQEMMLLESVQTELQSSAQPLSDHQQLSTSVPSTNKEHSTSIWAEPLAFCNSAIPRKIAKLKFSCGNPKKKKMFKVWRYILKTIDSVKCGIFYQ